MQGCICGPILQRSCFKGDVISVVGYRKWKPLENKSHSFCSHMHRGFSQRGKNPHTLLSYTEGMIVLTRSWENDREERDFCGFQLHSKIYLILFSDTQGLNNTVIHSWFHCTLLWFARKISLAIWIIKRQFSTGENLVSLLKNFSRIKN